MRRVRWRGVILGTAVALVLVWVFGSILSSQVVRPKLDGFLYELAGVEDSGRSISGTGEQWMSFEWLHALVGISSLFFAHFLGGFVAGRMAITLPGLNGATTAALAALFGVARFLIAVLPLIVDPSIDPRTRSENGGLFLFQGLGFIFVSFPVTLLAGFLGGRTGGKLRSGP